MRRPFFALAAASFLAWSAPAQAGPFGALYAFGDSLSDAGNVYALTSGQVPGPPYANGQFSNGPVWAQTLAAGLGLAPPAPSLLGGTDYAFGRAETGTTPTHGANGLDLPSQFQAFSQTHPVAPSDALYTLWIGSNDLLDALTAGPSVDPRATADAAVANVQGFLRDLAAKGARDVLLVTVPDLGFTPRLNGSPATEAAGSALAAYFDRTLLSALGADPLLSGLDLGVVDAYALIDDAVAHPASYGFTDVTDACLVGSAGFSGGTPCATPDTHLFWDSIHPTAATHAVIGREALAVVAEVDVPEPGSFALLGAGVAALTWTRRRRAA